MIKELAEALYVLYCSKKGKKIGMLAAGVVVEKDGKFLLVREKSFIPGIRGKWNLPMGRRDKDEYPWENAYREGREETGYNFEITHSLGSYPILIGPLEILCDVYSAEIIEGKLTVPEDLMDVRWFTLEEIQEMQKKGQIFASYVLEAIADYGEKEFVRKAKLLQGIS